MNWEQLPPSVLILCVESLAALSVSLVSIVIASLWWFVRSVSRKIDEIGKALPTYELKDRGEEAHKTLHARVDSMQKEFGERLVRLEERTK